MTTRVGITSFAVYKFGDTTAGYIYGTLSTLCSITLNLPKYGTINATVSINTNLIGQSVPLTTSTLSATASITTTQKLSFFYTIEQTNFRWRNDDGDNSTATWAAPLNTNDGGIPPGNIYRLRIGLENNTLNSSIDLEPLYLDYRINGGAWKHVGKRGIMVQHPSLTAVVIQDEAMQSNTYLYDVWSYASGTTMTRWYVENLLDGTSSDWDPSPMVQYSTNGGTTWSTNNYQQFSYGSGGNFYWPMILLLEDYSAGKKVIVQNFQYSTTIVTLCDSEAYDFTSFGNLGARDAANDYYWNGNNCSIANAVRVGSTRPLNNGQFWTGYDWNSGYIHFHEITSNSYEWITNFTVDSKSSLDSCATSANPLIPVMSWSKYVGTNPIRFDIKERIGTDGTNVVLESSTIHSYPGNWSTSKDGGHMLTIPHPDFEYISIFTFADTNTDCHRAIKIYGTSTDNPAGKTEQLMDAWEYPNPTTDGVFHPESYNWRDILVEGRRFGNFSGQGAFMLNSGVMACGPAPNLTYRNNTIFDQYDRSYKYSYLDSGANWLYLYRMTTPDTFNDFSNDNTPISQHVTTGTYDSTQSVILYLPSDIPKCRSLAANTKIEFEFVLDYKAIGAEHTEGDLIEFRIAGDPRIIYPQTYPRLGIVLPNTTATCTASTTMLGTPIYNNAVNESVSDTFNISDSSDSSSPIKLTETIHVNDTLVGSLGNNMYDDIYIHANTYAILSGYETVLDYIDVSSDLIVGILHQLFERVSMVASVDTLGTLSYNINNTLHLKDFSYYGLTVNLLENLEIVDSFDILRELHEILRINALLEGHLSSQSSLNESLSALLEITSKVGIILFGLLSENIETSLTSEYQSLYNDYNLESIRAVVNSLDQIEMFTLLDEKYKVYLEGGVECVFGASVSDSMVFIPALPTPWKIYEGFVMNPENSAVSRYLDYNFSTSSRFGDKYLLGNSDGLYQLDSVQTTDRANFKTASLSFGVEAEKQVPQVYLGTNSESDWILTVDIDGRYSATYKLSSDQNSTKMIKIGKGLIGQNWQFELITDQDLDLDTFEMYPVILGRKI